MVIQVTFRSLLGGVWLSRLNQVVDLYSLSVGCAGRGGGFVGFPFVAGFGEAGLTKRHDRGTIEGCRLVRQNAI